MPQFYGSRVPPTEAPLDPNAPIPLPGSIYGGYVAGSGMPARTGGLLSGRMINTATGAGMGGGGGLLGAAPRGYNPASGGVPGVTSPATSLTELINAISSSAGGLAGVQGQLTNAASTALRNQYPAEYFSTLGTLLGNVGRRAAGDISDLLPEIQQRNAEMALGGGIAGSGLANTKLLKDMGLTRYGVENEALQGLGQIQGLIPKVGPVDVSQFIPGIRDWMGAQERADIYRAAPVPEEAYRRANAAARGGGGGGGGGATGGVRYGGGAGGAVGNVDQALRNTGYGPPVIGRGTQAPGYVANQPAPWGSVPFFNQPKLAPGDNPWATFDPINDTDPLGTFDPIWDTQTWGGQPFDPIWDTNPYTGGIPGTETEYGGSEYEDYPDEYYDY